MNAFHHTIRDAQVADLDIALAVLRTADTGGLSGPIKTVAGLRRVLAEAQDMTTALLAHNAAA